MAFWGLMQEKGNHKHDGFDMGRLPHHRGKGANGYHWDAEKQEMVRDKKKRGLSDNQVCVPCAVNRKGLSVAKVGKLGKVNTLVLQGVLGEKLTDTVTLCTDKEKAYRPFSVSKDIKLVQLQDLQTKNGIYHIQNINNYHSRLKKFMTPFNGVATKYLSTQGGAVNETINPYRQLR